jgi:hypothetical protein
VGSGTIFSPPVWRKPLINCDGIVAEGFKQKKAGYGTTFFLQLFIPVGLRRRDFCC